MAAAGRIVAGTLALVQRHVRPGVSTEELDRLAEDFIRSHPGARPSFKGLYDFPATLCTSINAEVVHGIPSAKRILREGDLLSVDVGVWLEGLHADAAATFAVGKVASGVERLLQVTQDALAAGVAQARAGNHVGDIGHAVQQVAEAAGYSAVLSSLSVLASSSWPFLNSLLASPRERASLGRRVLPNRTSTTARMIRSSGTPMLLMVPQAYRRQPVSQRRREPRPRAAPPRGRR